MDVLVTGGTGVLGQHLVAQLSEAGHVVRVLSRRPRPSGHVAAAEWAIGDLVTGTGVAAALQGMDAVIHCASNPRRPESDIDAMRQLIHEASAAKCPHLIYVSIVGVESIPLGYYKAKRTCESLLSESEIPWSIVRATQFHELLRGVIAGSSRSLLVPALSGVAFQPVAAQQVAARLAATVAEEPSLKAEIYGGPQIHTYRDLVEQYLTVAERRRWVVPLRLWGSAYQGFRAGENLAPQHANPGQSFEEFLRAEAGIQAE